MTTDRPDFTAIALRRLPVHLRIAADGHDLRNITALPLWREEANPKGERYTRETWRCLLLSDGVPHTIHVNPDDARVTGDMGFALPALHLNGMEVARGTDAMFAEFVALCARFAIRCRWSYQKAGSGFDEERRGVPAGTKADLLFALDADRSDALRSFRLDGIAALIVLPGQRLPVWTPAGYQLPAVTP